MLTIRNVSKSFDKKVLDGFSYEFPDAGLFLIRGKSGAGKTTLLRIIAGLEKADEGEVETSGVLSVVFQEPRLLPHLSLLENVLIVKKKKDLDKAKELLEKFGLWEAKDLTPDALSGGMKLRASIVRSLYYGGDVFLWDEPTRELDPENRALVTEVIGEKAKDSLFLVVTHDPQLSEGTEIILN